ncbi:MAG: hypothetical protein ABSE16_10205 [Verrucomicrobiota bacterium]|jgi:hypothetical protein
MKVEKTDGLRHGQCPCSHDIVLPPSPLPSLGLRDIIIVLVVAWAARLAFMLLLPPGARSTDVFSWETVAKILAAGGNPYQATTVLNWPPLWMQLLFCLSKVSVALGVPFLRVLQIFLILVESVVMVLTIKLIRDVEPTTTNARQIALIGLALNPIAVLLVCQHCNFDVLVALWLMLFMNSLLRYNRTENVTHWLSACLFLGLGILTKTVPLLLVPMLAGGFRRATATSRFIGSALLLGPVTLGMSIIFVLAPADVTSKVLLYHSQVGAFGIPGLIRMALNDEYRRVYNLVFCGLLLTGFILLSLLFWRRHCFGNRETVLFAAILLAAIPCLGPGYATQYIYWFMPFLVATYAFFTRQWRVVLAGFALIAVCTYLFEYAVLPEYGSGLLYVLYPASLAGPDQSAVVLPSFYNNFPLVKYLASARAHTLLQIPIFVAYLAVLVFGGRILCRQIFPLRRRGVLE